jgi:hypothetical protein
MYFQTDYFQPIECMSEYAKISLPLSYTSIIEPANHALVA